VRNTPFRLQNSLLLCIVGNNKQRDPYFAVVVDLYYANNVTTSTEMKVFCADDQTMRRALGIVHLASSTAPQLHLYGILGYPCVRKPAGDRELRDAQRVVAAHTTTTREVLVDDIQVVVPSPGHADAALTLATICKVAGDTCIVPIAQLVGQEAHVFAGVTEAAIVLAVESAFGGARSFRYTLWLSD
jgi:hypothetical protein